MAGEILKKRREDLGQDIQEIADLLKISAVYLNAIENDSFAELPAPVYTMGYVRCYAKYLGVEAGEIIDYYTKNLSQPGHTTIMPVAFSRKKLPIFRYGLLVVICAVAVFFFLNRGRIWQPETASAPSRGAVIAESMRPQTSQPPVDSRVVSSGGHNLEIAATDLTWVYVKFADGRSEEMLLRPGNSKALKFTDKVILKVGNAGGITVRLDEKDLGAPGRQGQVVTLSLPAL